MKTHYNLEQIQDDDLGKQLNEAIFVGARETTELFETGIELGLFVLDALTALLIAMDIQIERILAFHRAKNEAPACKRGCAWCCSQDVSVVPLEAFNIAHHLGKRFGNKLTKRLRANSKARWKGEKPPCVFLDRRRCSIYPFRPIACRTYFTLDARACRAVAKNGHGDVVWLGGAMVVAAGAAHALLGATHQDGKPIPFQLLEDALLAIHMAGGAKSAWERLVAGQLVFSAGTPATVRGTMGSTGLRPLAAEAGD